MCIYCVLCQELCGGPLGGKYCSIMSICLHTRVFAYCVYALFKTFILFLLLSLDESTTSHVCVMSSVAWL